jgi:hypothetical protein
MKVTNPNKSALCFIREIENLGDNLSDSNISRFIDVRYSDEKKTEEIDMDAQVLLDRLKNSKIPAKLNSKTNIFRFQVNILIIKLSMKASLKFWIKKVKWKDNGIDQNMLDEYLNNFGTTFYEQIKRLIDEAVIKEKSKEQGLKETYRMIGILNEKKDANNLNKTNNETSEELKDFKDLMLELGLQIIQYNENTASYFGREYLMNKVSFFCST